MRRAADYDHLVPAGATRLVGGGYAPLRAEFARARWRRPVGNASVRSIHLSLGATDPCGHLGAVLDGVAASGFNGKLVLSLSPLAVGYRDVCARVAAMGGVVLPPDACMAGSMAACDLAIGAGGVGMLERACLGLPQVLVEVAANQRANLAAVAAARGGLVVGPPRPASVAHALRVVLSDRVLRDSLARNGAALCDGLGARRVAMELLDEPCRLRPATIADSDMLFEWQREPGTRRYARDPKPPEPEAHRAWLDARLVDRRCVFLVMEEVGTPRASVRLDWREEEAGFEVSLVVAPGVRGRGYGVRALLLARRLVAGEDLLAHVQAANEASLRSFSRAGYVSAGQPEWYVNRGGRSSWVSA
jgi:RimJ/RimL family protein N-acetyltransferase